MFNEFDRKTIGNEIKKARKLKKLSQFELAELTGVDEKQIYRIEAGISSPKLENFLKIANVLNLKINYFNQIDTNQKYIKEIVEILDNSSENNRKIYYNVLKSLNENI